MVRTAAGQPANLGSPAGPPPAPLGFRQRGAIFVRRHRLVPYLLLLPSAAVIAALVLWPTIQIAELSFQNYGLPQLVGTSPTQWIGVSNYSQILHDPEFWLSLRLSVLSAAVMVPLTLSVGTLVGLLLSRLGRKMAAFVSSVSVLAWATPAVSASVIFVWLATPDGGVVDWFLTKVPSWLIIIGELGQRDEYNLGIYEYATAFTLPPAYGLASALAFILTIILLIVTVGYVRASVREGALR